MAAERSIPMIQTRPNPTVSFTLTLPAINVDRVSPFFANTFWKETAVL